MTTLDDVRRMKQQGLSEQEIVGGLQQQGIAPKAITDALSQSKIKDAVMGEEMAQPAFEPGVPPAQPTNQGVYTPAVQDMSSPPLAQEEQPPYNQGAEDYYPQEGYDAGYSPGVGTDTIIEVAEQVFEEKIKKIGKDLDGLREFSTIYGTKISNFEDRIKRIENTIENLQIKILEKIGSYGQGIDSIKKEMTMMQESFSKTLPSLVNSQITKKVPLKKVAKKKVLRKKQF